MEENHFGMGIYRRDVTSGGEKLNGTDCRGLNAYIAFVLINWILGVFGPKINVLGILRNDGVKICW